MLDRLGFTKTLEVNKWRETWKVGTATISLDTVDGLGTFAEIEVITKNEDENPTDQIGKIAKEIGVEGEPILASYLEMLLARNPEGQSR
jgi:adenylate cyclase class 2